MKTTLRTRIAAAAILLAPMGAMLVATPAAAEHDGYWANRAARVQGTQGGYDYRGGYDRVAPRITDVTPDNGARVDDRGRTQIAARFDERGTGVANVNLRVDGRDVTHRARVDGNEIRYAENLQPGRHVAELVVRDRAGNTTRRSWSFDVVDHDRGRGYGRDQGYGYGYGYGRDDGYGRRW